MTNLKRLAVAEIFKLTGDKEISIELFDRFIKYETHKKCVTNWLIDILISDCDLPFTSAFTMVASMLENSTYDRVKNSYYKSTYYSLKRLEKIEIYRALRKTLEGKYPYKKFWDSFIPFVFANAKHVAVEILLENRVPRTEICIILDVSEITICRINRRIKNGKREENL